MQRQFAFTKLFHVYQTNVILKFYAYLQFIGIKSNWYLNKLHWLKQQTGKIVIF